MAMHSRNPWNSLVTWWQKVRHVTRAAVWLLIGTVTLFGYYKYDYDQYKYYSLKYEALKFNGLPRTPTTLSFLALQNNCLKMCLESSSCRTVTYDENLGFCAFYTEPAILTGLLPHSCQTCTIYVPQTEVPYSTREQDGCYYYLSHIPLQASDAHRHCDVIGDLYHVAVMRLPGFRAAHVARNYFKHLYQADFEGIIVQEVVRNTSQAAPEPDLPRRLVLFSVLSPDESALDGRTPDVGVQTGQDVPARVKRHPRLEECDPQREECDYTTEKSTLAEADASDFIRPADDNSTGYVLCQADIFNRYNRSYLLNRENRTRPRKRSLKRTVKKRPSQMRHPAARTSKQKLFSLSVSLPSLQIRIEL